MSVILLRFEALDFVFSLASSSASSVCNAGSSPTNSCFLFASTTHSTSPSS